MLYNKLVRDKIPQIIKESGKYCKYRVASDEEYRTYLHAKLMEESYEFMNDPSVSEAADVMEVLEALLRVYGIDKQEVQRARVDKIKDRGSFNEKLVLLGVDD
jgi:predicted house-cleaning noncanonical NTP pyrophosphatase (MazG superfamily)